MASSDMCRLLNNSSLGGYETWLCSGSLLEVNAAEKLEQALTALVKSLK